MFRSVLLAMVSLGVAATGALAGDCKSIKFPRGKSSATIRGTAESENLACYTLETNAGQTATVKLVGRPGDDTAFNIGDVVDNQDNYTFRTRRTTYRIDVYRTFARERPVPFTMSVSVR